MSGDKLPPLFHFGDASQLPKTLSETIEQLKKNILHQFMQEVARKQLFYHTDAHIRDVQRRSHQIFTVIAPALDPNIDLTRIQLLLDLCAVSHDLIQNFEPGAHPHASRQRQSGVNERVTVDQLIHLIHELNDQLEQHTPNSPARLTQQDIVVIQQAIAATICTYDSQEQAIYQPLLYSGEPLSVVSRILALADLGTLGMEGIEAFNHEGRLLFLEENPDVVPLLQNDTIYQLPETDPELSENIRQRLLKRSCFQVNFARSRLHRFKSELQGLPERTLPILLTETFKHLTPATIQIIAATTPTDRNTELHTLLQFFQLQKGLGISGIAKGCMAPAWERGVESREQR